MSCKISVIVPSYEPKEYIYCCINSLLNQTLEQEKYNIIIVLNGAKEPYYSKLKEKYKNYSLIKIIYTLKNGVSNARNIGLANSESDYVVFIDDDDFVSKHFLKGLYEKRVENGIVVSNTLTIDEQNKIGIDYLGKHFKEKKINKNKQNLIFHRKQLSNSCGKLISKNIIKQNFNTNFKVGEDALFMAELSEGINKINYSLNKCIYYRRIRFESASRKKEIKQLVIKRKKNLILEYSKLLFKLKTNKIFILTRILAQLKN